MNVWAREMRPKPCSLLPRGNIFPFVQCRPFTRHLVKFFARLLNCLHSVLRSERATEWICIIRHRRNCLKNQIILRQYSMIHCESNFSLQPPLPQSLQRLQCPCVAKCHNDIVFRDWSLQKISAYQSAEHLICTYVGYKLGKRWVLEIFIQEQVCDVLITSLSRDRTYIAYC